jgi:hypothetical protein
MSDFNHILQKSINSGTSGAIAMSAQVTTLMWMRTIMNYQYRHGDTIKNTVKILYNDGGIPRFYRGYLAALAQGPLSRFGDTFSNTLALTLCQEQEILKKTPIAFQTGFASIMAGGCRILLMPIDTVKTNLQVNGSIIELIKKYKQSGPKVFYNGSIATCTSTITGHFPWFYTYNYLQSVVPKYEDNVYKLTRNAFIGFSASIASDTISNSVRVLKTAKQTYSVNENATYANIAIDIIKKDGCRGLLGRGLPIRLCTNGIQGALFSVLWKIFE